jgi:hypothetical protein
MTFNLPIYNVQTYDDLKNFAANIGTIVTSGGP